MFMAMLSSIQCNPGFKRFYKRLKAQGKIPKVALVACMRMMIVVLNISNVTPPVGMTLMTAARIAEVPYERAIVASLPFYVSFLVVIVLLAAFPVLSTWIPSLL